jgi:hypothetical protein
MLVSCLAYSSTIKMEAMLFQYVGLLSLDYTASYVRNNNNNTDNVCVIVLICSSNVFRFKSMFAGFILVYGNKSNFAHIGYCWKNQKGRDH